VVPFARSETSRIPPITVNASQIERLVVEDAQGETVALDLRPDRLVPADVGGVQGDRHRAEPNVESANGAAIFPIFRTSRPHFL